MHPPRQSNRGFGLTFAAFFAVVAGLVWWFADRIAVWAVAAVVLFLALALIAPGLLLPLNRLWMAFLVRFSGLSNRLFLGIVFYGLLLPTGLVLRALGSDPMERKRSRVAASYWRPVGRGTTRETLRDMF